MDLQQPVSRRARIRSMIEEVVWWHVQCHDDPDTYPVSYREVMSMSRRRLAVAARNDSMRRVRETYRLSYPRIGEIFGRDHTTVMFGLGRTSRPIPAWRRPKLMGVAAE